MVAEQNDIVGATHLLLVLSLNQPAAGDGSVNDALGNVFLDALALVAAQMPGDRGGGMMGVRRSGGGGD